MVLTTHHYTFISYALAFMCVLVLFRQPQAKLPILASLVHSSFRILAQLLDCDYNFLIGTCQSATINDPQKEDIYVNCQKLEKWLTECVKV